MKIYISGKITGDRRYKAKFREVEKKLAAAGHIVLNPATAPEGLRPVDYMRLCFAMMEAADVVLFMQDYAEARDAMVYVGIAADETPRLEKERKPYKLHPLAEWGMTEADALAYCYENGFSWLEGTIRLYDVLDRVSCWCCCNKNLRELRNMYASLPEYWERLKDLQRKIDRPMKGYYKGQPRGVFELEQRFRVELEQEAKA